MTSTPPTHLPTPSTPTPNEPDPGSIDHYNAWRATQGLPPVFASASRRSNGIGRKAMVGVTISPGAKAVLHDIAKEFNTTLSGLMEAIGNGELTVIDHKQLPDVDPAYPSQAQTRVSARGLPDRSQNGFAPKAL